MGRRAPSPNSATWSGVHLASVFGIVRTFLNQKSVTPPLTRSLRSHPLPAGEVGVRVLSVPAHQLAVVRGYSGAMIFPGFMMFFGSSARFRRRMTSISMPDL